MRHSAITGLGAFLGLLLIVTGAVGQEGEPDGETLFARYCASCHGRLGEGDGPVAGAMAVSVPNLRTLSDRSDGTFPREAVIRYIDGREPPAAHGDRLMPVWGNTFAETTSDPEAGENLARRRIAAITDFIEQLQR